MGTVRDLTGNGGIEPLWYTAGETRQRLNISDSTLKRLTTVGALKALPLGREKRFLRTEVEGIAAFSVEKLQAIAERLAALSRRNKARAAKGQKAA